MCWPAQNSSSSEFRIRQTGVATEQVERKTFVFTLKENPRGRFLRITEDVNGRRDAIIVPATGLEDFRKILDTMAQVSAETPPKA